MNAAPSLVCVMEENAPTLQVATCAPVHEVTSRAQMAPNVLVSLKHIHNSFLTFISLVCAFPHPLASQKLHIWLVTSLPLSLLPVSRVLMNQAGLQTCGHHVQTNTLTHTIWSWQF